MTLCLPEKDYVTRGWHKLSRGDKPSYLTLTRLLILYYIEYPTQCHNYLVLFISDNRYQVMANIQYVYA